MLLLQGLYQIARAMSCLQWNRALSCTLAIIRKGYTLFPPRSAPDYYVLAKAHRYEGAFSMQASSFFLRASELAPENGTYLADYLLDMFNTGRMDSATAIAYLPRMSVVSEPDKRLLLKAMLHDLDLAQRAEETFPDVTNDSRFIACFDPAGTQQERFAEKYAQFVDYLRRHRHSIAIVGNSPCELRQGKGREIDAHDVVIRLNNFVTEAPFEKDYGCKTDVWVRGIDQRIREKPDVDFMFIAYAVSYLFARPLDWEAKVIPYQQRGIATLTFGELYHRLYHTLGSPPSSGLLTVQAVCDIIGPDALPDCYGFAFTDHLKPGARSHYFERFTISRQHDWVKEAEYFKELMGKRL